MRHAVPVLLLSLGVLLSCGDGKSPTDSGGPSVASLELSPGTLALQLGDTVRVSVTARDAAGSMLSGAAVTWSSNAPAVATVDGTGLVRGVGGGTAVITASSGSVRSEVTAEVAQWNIAASTVVVDSTVLRLVSDSAELAAGVLRFQRLGDPAPEIAAGHVLVGAQGPGFLRRVTSVSTADGMITAQTEAASLNEVVLYGGFATSVPVGLGFPQGELSGVTWGPQETRVVADGVQAMGTGLDLSGLDLCALAGCPPAVTAFEVKTGTVDFAPELELAATFADGDLTAFRGIGRGALTLDFNVLLEAEQATKFEPDARRIAEISRIFYAQIGAVPIVGIARFDVKAKFSASATIKGRIQAGFTNTHQVDIGARWSQGEGWEGVFESVRAFDAQEPSLSDSTLLGQVTMESRIAVIPELQVLLYGVAGPLVNVEPWGKATVEFGTAACGIKSEAGIDSSVGFVISFLDPKIGRFDRTFSPFEWPGLDWICPLGTLDISTVTNGPEPDPDGYAVLVDGVNRGSIDGTGSLLLPWLPVGQRSVQLTGVANNCTVQGGNPRGATLVAGLIEAVDFVIECSATTGDLRVETVTTGGNIDVGGYTVTVDGSQSQHVGPNEVVVFRGLAAGERSVGLDDVAPNCSVAQNPQAVDITAGQEATARFEVACSDALLTVVTSTSGTPASGSGYQVTVGSETRPMAFNETSSFSLLPGSHTVTLGNIPSNCTIQGDNPRTVSVPADGAETQFDVACESGTLRVDVATNGDPEVALFTATVTGHGSQSIPATGGAATFEGLPAGSYSVELSAVPEKCVVTGANPRTVPAPGATTFLVDCDLGDVGEIIMVCFPNVCGMNGDGTGVRPLATTTGSAAHPAWSPTGEYIALQLTPEAPTKVIARVDADGTGLIHLTDGPDDLRPAWSPDGEKIAFYRHYPEFGIWVMNKDGSGLTMLYEYVDPSEGDTNIQITSGPVWSPDGTQLAFTGGDLGVDVWDPPLDVFIMNAAGGTPTRVTSFDGVTSQAFGVSWSRQGQLAIRSVEGCTLAACEWSGVSIWEPSGTLVRRLEATRDTPMGAGAWHPDGSRLVFALGNSQDYERGIWIVDADGTELKLLLAGSYSYPQYRPPPPEP
jgi:Tol biopolymer transport system component